MKKTTLLLAGTLFFVFGSIAFPLLGFALLEPSALNLFIICWFFLVSVLGSYAFCETWIKERRKAMKSF